jgi:signal transduction histidine kinase
LLRKKYIFTQIFSFPWAKAASWVNISKIASGQINTTISEANINEQIEHIFSFFKPTAEQKGIQFFLNNSLPANEANIKTDYKKLDVILSNLVKNAIKFTKTGSIEFGYKKKDGHLEFFVKDTGIGIPHENMNIIFERFRQGSESYSRNYEGAGLGLSISKAYVEMLDGRIWVESEEGKGSKFYFTLPVL